MALNSAAKVRPAASWSHQLTLEGRRCSQCNAFAVDSRKPGTANSLRNHTFPSRHLGVPQRLSERRKPAPGVRASGEQNGADTAVKEKEEEKVVQERAKPTEEDAQLTLSDINPVSLGRRSREFFNDVWKRLTDLGQLTRSSPSDVDTVLIGGPMCEFTIPDAAFTTVLVAGATGRVGRILVRKLLLRGYTVKALVRSSDEATLEKLPTVVQHVVGDIGDPTTLSKAVEGVNKIICCTRATSMLSGDLTRVEQQGVANLAKAFLDYNHRLAQKRAGKSARSKVTLARFSKESTLDEWDLRDGVEDEDILGKLYDGGMDAELELTEREGERSMGLFQGYVYTRGGFVEMTTELKLPEGVSLSRFEGLLIRVCGDGKPYTFVLEMEKWEGGPPMEYTYKFPTRVGYARVRLPFSDFRPGSPDQPPLDPAQVKRMSIRFEPKKVRAPMMLAGAPAQKKKKVMAGRVDPMQAIAEIDTSSEGPEFVPGATETDLGSNRFKLEVDFIKALPAGEEPDFILVSCTGAGVEEEDREKVLRAKLAGEQSLRNSGLGYTIVRPGPLLEEPGGSRALVFDQGNRITQSISCADVADVCVKALHDGTARNKSFEVCYEYTSEQGQGLYELVAHLPDKSNNYLTPALALLEKNT
ncbi:hypothetical protein KFL_001390220 [Klebsormidium nitens]|uniref:NAD(P)-binding domain-containing protein n=1 Tax=Klebsormidium nitens TaxID=105231 RepID=A0A1Y1HX16_KLENI|nr:hypothetical protein KFL_001390220 [Klebsormidium nitens]|eukprot:GAQ83204.1 hypothetical protein KFL_001390220 [Klebsormidium nitens]